MTDFIDTALLKSGMKPEELCAVRGRIFYYAGTALFAGLAVTFAALTLTS